MAHEVERRTLARYLEEHNEELVGRFEAERNADDYERRMSGLLRRAYERLQQSDPQTPAMWQDGFDVLRRGDHYLVVLLKPVLQLTTAERLRRALGRG